MTYAAELVNNQFKQNVVVTIDGTTYAKFEPDTGLAVPVSNRIISTVKFNKTKLDLKRSITTISKLQVRLLDLDEIFSIAIGASTEALIGKEVTIKLGRITGSFDFGDYLETKSYTIRDIKQSGNFYDLDCTSRVDRLQTPVFDSIGTLKTSINDTVTTLDLETETDIFQTTGSLKLNSELMTYTGKTFLSGTTTFTGITRGVFSSTAAFHTAGDIGNEVKEITANPIDMLLQLLISSGGGGPFDVLHDGAAIDASFIDVTGFEAIRDSFFSGESIRLRFYEIENLLKFIEREILEARNVRLVEKSSDNKIGLAILNQSTVGTSAGTLDITNTRKAPRWRISAKTIANQITIKWNWNDGLSKFTRVNTFTDSDSITKYGLKKGPTLSFKSIQADLSGSSIVSDFANRYLDRFSTPKAEINCTSFLSTSLLNVGDKVLFESPEVPGEGGGLGISSVVEILAQGINWTTGDVKYDLIFTSYSNLRRGIISPSPKLDLAITSQKRFTVPDGTCYAIGYKLVLWDNVNKVYFSDPVNTVESIIGNEIIMENDFTTTLGSNTSLYFADYDEASTEQKSKFAYVAPDSGFFADGSKAYQIFL